MITTIYILLAILTVLIIIWVLRSPAASVSSSIPPVTEKSGVPCILCGTPLQRGERLKSEEYKGEESSLVYIFGCPHCHGPSAVNQRRCPVCDAVLKDDEHLFARMFYRKNGKRHLHVNGCSRCRTRA